MSSRRDRWLDRDAGPVVRPYAMTRGRTRPSAGDASFDLIALVSATGAVPGERDRLGPEHLEILELCGRPVPVVDVVSALDLPVGVVRVLLGDLREHALITVSARGPADQAPDEGVLKAVLSGLRAL